MADDLRINNVAIRVPFYLVTNYKTSNRAVWESFIGLSPKKFGTEDSFVTQLQKYYGISPFANLDFSPRQSSVTFGKIKLPSNSVFAESNPDYWQLQFQKVSFMGNPIGTQVEAVIDTGSASI
jgi:hypothetical protein